MATQTTPESADRWEVRGLLLGRVLHDHQALLRRDAARHTRCPADCDAAFSEACFRFLSTFQSAEDDVEHALRWLRLAVKHSAYAHYRAQQREVPQADVTVGSGSPFFGPAGDSFDSGHRERLDQLAALKPDERTALLLFAAGYSYAEIAELRGWTYTKVNRCITEAARPFDAWRGERIELPGT